jgi:hypothetical protein
VRYDISLMLSQLTLGQDSRPFIVTNSTVCKRWCMLSDQHGVSAFPDLGPQGGTINRIPVLVSDGVGSGLAYLIDASSIGANGGEMVFSEATETSIHFDDAPTSPPTASSAYLSLWQTNQTALKVERHFLIERLRSKAWQRLAMAIVGNRVTARHNGVSVTSRDEALIKAVGAILVEEVEPLRERIEALQARLDQMETVTREFGFRGPWQEDVVYRSGNFVSLGGSMWFCVADRTTSRPQTSSSDWALAVKRGRDGKDGHVVAEPRKPTGMRTYGSS